jgi:hypothetical protein
MRGQEKVSIWQNKGSGFGSLQGESFDFGHEFPLTEIDWALEMFSDE